MIQNAHKGFTLVEVIVAAAILGILAVGASRFVGDSMRWGRLERIHMTAARIANTELERLRASGAGGRGLVDDTFLVDASGIRKPNGEFRVEIKGAIACTGGSDPFDNLAENPWIVSECTDQRPVLTYTVTVQHLNKTTGQVDGQAITRSITLGGVAGRFGRAYAAP